MRRCDLCGGFASAWHNCPKATVSVSRKLTKAIVDDAYEERQVCDALAEAVKGLYALLPDAIAYMPADAALAAHKALRAKQLEARGGVMA